MLLIETGKIKFIDSVNLLLQPLDSLPKTFSLPSTKGLFPYKWISPEYYDYVGVFPQADAYGLDMAKPAKASEIKQWLDENKDGIFDFRRDYLDYCR